MPPMSPASPSVSSPKAKAKPTKYQQIAAIEKFVRTLATTVPAFFCRENPISRSMNPACMNITTMPATITHIVLRPTDVSPVVLSTPPLLLIAESTVSAIAIAGSARAISSPAPTAGSSLSAVVRLMRPPRLDAAFIDGDARRPPAQRLCPVVERSAGAVRHDEARHPPTGAANDSHPSVIDSARERS